MAWSAIASAVAGWTGGLGAQSRGYANWFLLTSFLAAPAYLLLPWVREADEPEIWLDLGGEFKYRMAAEVQGGKVFTPGLKAFVQFLPDAAVHISKAQGVPDTVYGAALILIVLLLPTGFAGGLRRALTPLTTRLYTRS